MISEMLKKILSEIRKENAHLTDEQFLEVQHKLEMMMQNEPPPKVAVIGETGVGKSSTLNALFNAGQDVGHIEATTQIEVPIKVDFAKGPLIIYDMPGLGESMGKRDLHLITYRRVLEKVDVALWILDAQYRAVESIQRSLVEDIGPINRKLTDKMVFALNKVDVVHPGDWHPQANLPSREQKKNIDGRIRDVQSKIRAVLPNWRGTVIGYSAAKYYNLPELFLAMLDAMPPTRRWVLTDRKELADFLEKVPQRFHPVSQTKTESNEAWVRELLKNMTTEQRASILEDFTK